MNPVVAQQPRRSWWWIPFAVLALVALAGASAVATAAAAPAVPARLTDQLANCQDMAAVARTSHEKAWAKDCATLAQRAIDAWIAAHPEPSPSISASPSPVVSPSPSASMSPTATQPPSPSPTVTQPTVTPTPSPSPTNQVDCLHQLAVCGFPNAANTGPSGTLTTSTGNLVVSTAGAVVENRDIRGCVRVEAANVVIRNVRITCPDGDHGGDYLRVRNNSTNLTLVDVEIDCLGGYGMGVGYGGYTLLRGDIHDCENGGHIDGAVTVRDSWIHALRGAADGHFDGFQFGQGAAGVVLQHNTIDNPNGQTSAIIMWDEADPQNRDVTITANMLAGGGWTLYCGRFGTAVNVAITNNRFAAGVLVNGQWIADPGGPQYGSANACNSGGEVWAGNVRDWTGDPLAAT